MLRGGWMVPCSVFALIPFLWEPSILPCVHRILGARASFSRCLVFLPRGTKEPVSCPLTLPARDRGWEEGKGSDTVVAVGPHGGALNWSAAVGRVCLAECGGLRRKFKVTDRGCSGKTDTGRFSWNSSSHAPKMLWMRWKKLFREKISLSISSHQAAPPHVLILPVKSFPWVRGCIPEGDSVRVFGMC